jgi:hypothetical protein
MGVKQTGALVFRPSPASEEVDNFGGMDISRLIHILSHGFGLYPITDHLNPEGPHAT